MVSRARHQQINGLLNDMRIIDWQVDYIVASHHCQAAPLVGVE